MTVAGIAGVLCGLGGYWGWHLYDTKQTPVEWGTKVMDDLRSSFQDAADPTEAFIRNSLMVGTVQHHVDNDNSNRSNKPTNQQTSKQQLRNMSELT